MFFGKEIRTDVRETQVTQIYKILVEEITGGRWTLNARFPSVTQLVNQSGLSRGSIQKVLALLDSDGFIATEARRGTFVISLEATTEPEPIKDLKPNLTGATKKEIEAEFPSLAIPAASMASAAFRNIESESSKAVPAPPSPTKEEKSEEPTPVEIAQHSQETPPIPSTPSPTPLVIPELSDSPFAPIKPSPARADNARPSGPSVSEARVGIALIKHDPRIQSGPAEDSSPILEGLLGMVQEFGYRSSVAFFDRSPDWDVLAKDGGPFDDRVDGIITLSSGGFADFTDPPEGSCPIVFIADAECRAFPGVTKDYALGAYRTTRDLIAAGHTHIALCPGNDTVRQQNFISGHREAMKRVGLTVDESSITGAADLQDGDFASLRTFLQQNNTATAILCGTHQRAADLVALSDALGIKIPSDLTIATAGRTPMRGDHSGETITGFDFPPEKLAHAALLLLDEIIHTGSCQFTQVKIPPTKIPGNTLAAPRR